MLLVLVLLVGKKVYGAYRWLSLFGIQVQPSEFAKLATLVVLARFLSRPGRSVETVRCVAQALAIVAIPFVLILKEPDRARRPSCCRWLFSCCLPRGRRFDIWPC